MNDNGNAFIFWTQDYGNMFKSGYGNGVWINPASLADYISPRSYWGSTAVLEIQYLVFGNLLLPQVAKDNNGNIIIVRIIPPDVYGSPAKIFKNEYRNGAWTTPTDISEHIGIESILGSLRVAIDNNGNYIIAWTQSDGSNNQVFKSEYRNGTWTDPASLADNISPDGQDAEFSQVAMDNNGNAIIVWSQLDGTNSQIFKSEYRNGAWINPASLSDNISPNGQDASAPQVAMDNNGNAIIVWSQSDGTNSQIFKSEYRNGIWYIPASLADNISPDGQDADNPQVTMDNSGNAIIVWSQFDGTNKQIFKSEYR
jgi:uncharacterized protein YheU (UPF0270 family)